MNATQPSLPFGQNNKTPGKKLGYTAGLSEAVEGSGELAWWTLAGATQWQRLHDEWLDLGLDDKDLPAQNKPETALRLAMQGLKRRHRNIEHLKDGGWALVEKSDKEDAAGANVDHRTTLRVWFDTEGDTDLKFSYPSESGYHELREEVEREYKRHGRELSTGEVSVWLVKQIYRLRSTSLKRTGSVYYVLPEAVDEWSRILEALEACGDHVVYRMKCMKDDEGAARAILHAIISEAEREMEKIHTVIGEGKQGERGLNNKRKSLVELESKLKRYEALLDTTLDDVREKMNKTDDDIGLALLDIAKKKEDTEAPL